MSTPRPPKPVVVIRRPARRPVRQAGKGKWEIPPALISAVLLAAVGGGGWWMLQQKPKGVTLPVEEVAAESLETAPVLEETPAAPVVANAVPAEVAPAMETPAASAVTMEPLAEPEPEADKPADFGMVLVLDSMGSAKPENAARFEATWKLAKMSGEWDAYRDFLARSLQGLVKSPADLAAVLENPPANLAMVRHAFLTAVPEEVLQPLRTDDEMRIFLDWLLETPEAMQPFAAQVSPQDDVDKALTVWASIAAEYPDAKTDYRDLAIACGLVFDRTIRAAHGGKGEAINPVARFNHFRQNAEAGKLIGKIKKMTAGDLIWVVGVPVTQEELDWAIKKTDLRQKGWGAYYGQIKYDMEKAVKGTDVYDEYTFAEILKKGGICSDQSYFTAWTACAHAIPAAILSGDGPRGPHAWMTWMADEASWKSSGRIGGYPAGSGRDPQTGESISEEEFLRFNDPKNGSPLQVLKSRRLLWLAQVCASKPDLALALITDAVKTAPRLTAPSAALVQHWMTHRAESPVTEWTGLLRDLRKNFRDSASLMELATEAEEKFVFTRQDVASTIKNLRREAKKLNDTSSADAGITADPKRLTASLRRQAEVMKAKNDHPALRLLYKNALADHGKDPATFKALAKDFFEFSKEDPALAAKACHELENACRRNVGRGQGEYFDVLGQNSAWLVVADLYYKAGDPEKSDQIKRECEARIKMAKKQAL